MNVLKSLTLALLLAVSMPVISMAAEDADKGEKIEVTALPAPVKSGFAKEVPGGEIASVKKLGGEKVRYQIKYKLEGKEHQITLDEAGARMAHKKKEGEKEGGDAK
jgi:hypothetical protein